MIKKRFLIISLLMAMLSFANVSVYADSVDLQVGYIDPRNFSIGVNVVEEDEAGQLIFNRIGNTLWISFSIDTNELGYMYLCSLTITKLSTGVQVYSDEIGGNLFEVDTTNWPSGIYVATVSILGTTDTYSGSFIIN